MVSEGAQVVVGASGGLGRALVAALVARRTGPVYAFSRTHVTWPAEVAAARLDLLDEASIVAAIDAITEPVALAVVATGLLHDEGLAPERSYLALDPSALRRSFEVNAIGPALLAKHLLPRLPKDRRAVFAALSARVGSIGDNRLGGWYGYRASKAALNMMVRTLAVELRRTRPQAICVALHPGTVDTAMSQPFQGRVRPEALFTPEHSAERLLRVVDGLGADNSGGFYAYDGSTIPF